MGGEFFECKIRDFEDIKFENRIPPEAGIEVRQVVVTYGNPYPWDAELINLLAPLRAVQLRSDSKWHEKIPKKIVKLQKKLDALKFHIESFKEFEKLTEEDYRNNMVANTSMDKIFEDPNLIHNVESFLFQSKSALDVFAQLIGFSFKFNMTTYRNEGRDIINQLQKHPSKFYLEEAMKMIDIIKKNEVWIKDIVKMRDEVTHHSDLEGLACFLIKQSNENDTLAKVYYPKMPSGDRVSTYLDGSWNRIRTLIEESIPSLCSAIVKQG